MAKITASITTSLDGYIAGPDDGPGRGLGKGGKALHQWVFGGQYAEDKLPEGTATGVDKDYLDEKTADLGAVIAGRWTYEAAEHWGDKNPWDVPLYIVTHRPEEEPAVGDFRFVGSVQEALGKARIAAGDKVVNVMGGADVIRQALATGEVEELSIIVAPIILGGGKRLFDGFDERIELEHIGVRQSPFATFIDYRVKRSSCPRRSLGRRHARRVPAWPDSHRGTVVAGLCGARPRRSGKWPAERPASVRLQRRHQVAASSSATSTSAWRATAGSSSPA